MKSRVWGIIDGCRDCVFITLLQDGRCRARTMNKIQDMNRSGGIMWFATDSKSRKISEIAANPRVTLFFAHPETFDHACISGKAQVVRDAENRLRFWNDDWYRYWKAGPKSEEYVLIKVVPEKGEYFLNEEVMSGEISFDIKSL